MSVNIRNAQPADMPGVLELIKELAEYEKEPDAVIIDVDYLVQHGFGDGKKFNCLVAQEADNIIGMALFYERFSTWKGVTFHLEDLIVTSSRRGTGVGLSLYKAFLDKAFKHGVKRVEWAVLDWNEPAIRFYEKSGALVLRDWDTVQMDRSAMQKFLCL
jgi:GNAT superfamily N-acetyltransferase